MSEGVRRSLEEVYHGQLMRMRLMLALLCQLVAAGCSESESPRWNVLIIVPDTVRGDHLSINGYPRPTSPRIDQLARQGANFTQAITVAPRTWQSFAAILTGLYPPRHGVRFLFDEPLAEEVPTLATLLQAAGYETAAFDGLPFLKQITGDRGFDEHLVVGIESGRDPDDAVVDRVSAWVRVERRRPFFAFVRLLGAHWPYQWTKWSEHFDACEGQAHTFNEGSYGTASGGSGRGVRLVDREARREQLWNSHLERKELDHMVAHYDGKIRATDVRIGRLLDEMEGAGLLEETIVVVTSDHGESFGEHGYLQHGPRVDESVMRVPLVVKLPQAHPDFRGAVSSDEMVRVIDVAPTVLDAVGLEAPVAMDGTSLVPALRGEEMPELWAYGESGRSFGQLDPERYVPGVAGKHRMIRKGGFKLVFVPGGGRSAYRLFDVQRDPGERRDLAAELPEKVEELRAHLESVMAFEEGREEEQLLSKQELEMLRELGYAD